MSVLQSFNARLRRRDLTALNLVRFLAGLAFHWTLCSIAVAGGSEISEQLPLSTRQQSTHQQSTQHQTSQQTSDQQASQADGESALPAPDSDPAEPARVSKELRRQLVEHYRHWRRGILQAPAAAQPAPPVSPEPLADLPSDPLAGPLARSLAARLSEPDTGSAGGPDTGASAGILPGSGRLSGPLSGSVADSLAETLAGSRRSSGAPSGRVSGPLSHSLSGSAPAHAPQRISNFPSSADPRLSESERSLLRQQLRESIRRQWRPEKH